MSIAPDREALPGFDAIDLLRFLEAADALLLDRLAFGVIRMDRAGTVRHYNHSESAASGLSPDRVVGRHFFTEVGPCMNNFMVATRFEEEPDLDATMDYVFTLRMRPVPVRIRMLSAPWATHMYLAVTSYSAVPL